MTCTPMRLVCVCERVRAQQEHRLGAFCDTHPTSCADRHQRDSGSERQKRATQERNKDRVLPEAGSWHQRARGADALPARPVLLHVEEEHVQSPWMLSAEIAPTHTPTKKPKKYSAVSSTEASTAKGARSSPCPPRQNQRQVRGAWCLMASQGQQG